MLFGGVDPGLTKYDDTWEWNGAKWLRHDVTGPSRRAAATTAFDDARNVTVLVGGSTDSGISDQTWEWDGDQWSLMSSGAPGPRLWNALAYDSARGLCILHGGYGSATSWTETWGWNAGQWNQQQSAGPSLYGYNSATFDARRNKLTVFARHYSDSLGPAETWELGSNGWIQPTPSVSPSPRSFHASAFDSRRGVHVVFGGIGGAQTFADTWEWDGFEWTQLLTSGVIRPRESHSLTYDAARNTLIVFGGSPNLEGELAWITLGDLWELDLSATPTAITQPVSPSICAGSSVTLKSTFDGPGPFAYRWRRDGQWLTDDVHRLGTNSDTLVFTDTQPGDSGVYECRAVNACAQAFCKPSTLTVFPTNTADGNLDGLTDARDIAIFVDSLINFAPVSAPLCAYDLTGEGIVSDADIPPFVTRLLAE